MEVLCEICGPCCKECCGDDGCGKCGNCLAPQAFNGSPQPGTDPGACGCDGECNSYDMENDNCCTQDGTFCIYVHDPYYAPPRHRSHYVYTTFPPVISKKERSMHRCAVRFWIVVCLVFVGLALLCGLVSWINVMTKLDYRVFLVLAGIFFLISCYMFQLLACCSGVEDEEPVADRDLELVLIQPQPATGVPVAPRPEQSLNSTLGGLPEQSLNSTLGAVKSTGAIAGPSGNKTPAHDPSPQYPLPASAPVKAPQPTPVTQEQGPRARELWAKAQAAGRPPLPTTVHKSVPSVNSTQSNDNFEL